MSTHARIGALVLVLVIAAHLLLYWSPWFTTDSEVDPHPHVEASSFATRLPAIQRHRPDAFEGCGTWQEHYRAYHRRVLAGQLPPRYLVAVLVQAGLADQLLGVITAFYAALLTGRAFQITAGHQALASLEAAFDAPFVNWTRPLDPLPLTKHMYHMYQVWRCACWSPSPMYAAAATWVVCRRVCLWRGASHVLTAHPARPYALAHRARTSTTRRTRW